MAATYDAAQLATKPIYRIRLKIGDTDIADAELQDEEIEFFLSDFPDDELRAAIACCEAVLNKMAKRYDFKLGPSENKVSQQYNRYSKVLYSLTEKIVGYGTPTFCNPERTIFSVDMMNATHCTNVNIYDREE